MGIPCRGRCPAVLPGAGGCVGRGLATWRLCRGGPVSPCLQQSPSIIVADTGRWRWCVLRGPAVESLLPCWTKVGNYEVLFPCHSVYLEFALHTLWVYALFICSWRCRGCKRKEGGREARFALSRSLTWEELGWWRCWAHLHTQWCNISSPFHQEPRSYSNK